MGDAFEIPIIEDIYDIDTITLQEIIDRVSSTLQKCVDAPEKAAWVKKAKRFLDLAGQEVEERHAVERFGDLCLDYNVNSDISSMISPQSQQNQITSSNKQQQQQYGSYNQQQTSQNQAYGNVNDWIKIQQQLSQQPQFFDGGYASPTHQMTSAPSASQRIEELPGDEDADEEEEECASDADKREGSKQKNRMDMSWTSESEAARSIVSSSNSQTKYLAHQSRVKAKSKQNDMQEFIRQTLQKTRITDAVYVGNQAASTSHHGQFPPSSSSSRTARKAASQPESNERPSNQRRNSQQNRGTPAAAAVDAPTNEYANVPSRIKQDLENQKNRKLSVQYFTTGKASYPKYVPPVEKKFNAEEDKKSRTKNFLKRSQPSVVLPPIVPLKKQTEVAGAAPRSSTAQKAVLPLCENKSMNETAGSTMLKKQNSVMSERSTSSTTTTTTLPPQSQQPQQRSTSETSLKSNSSFSSNSMPPPPQIAVRKEADENPTDSDDDDDDDEVVYQSKSLSLVPKADGIEGLEQQRQKVNHINDQGDNYQVSKQIDSTQNSNPSENRSESSSSSAVDLQSNKRQDQNVEIAKKIKEVGDSSKESNVINQSNVSNTSSHHVKDDEVESDNKSEYIPQNASNKSNMELKLSEDSKSSSGMHTNRLKESQKIQQRQSSSKSGAQEMNLKGKQSDEQGQLTDSEDEINEQQSGVQLQQQYPQRDLKKNPTKEGLEVEASMNSNQSRNPNIIKESKRTTSEDQDNEDVEDNQGEQHIVTASANIKSKLESNIKLQNNNGIVESTSKDKTIVSGKQTTQKQSIGQVKNASAEHEISSDDDNNYGESPPQTPNGQQSELQQSSQAVRKSMSKLVQQPAQPVEKESEGTNQYDSIRKRMAKLISGFNEVESEQAFVAFVEKEYSKGSEPTKKQGSSTSTNAASSTTTSASTSTTNKQTKGETASATTQETADKNKKPKNLVFGRPAAENPDRIQKKEALNAQQKQNGSAAPQDPASSTTNKGKNSSQNATPASASSTTATPHEEKAEVKLEAKPPIPARTKPPPQVSQTSKLLQRMMKEISDDTLIDYSAQIPSFAHLFSGYFNTTWNQANPILGGTVGLNNTNIGNFCLLDQMRDMYSMFLTHVDKVDNADKGLLRYKQVVTPLDVQPSEIYYQNDPSKVVVYQNRVDIDMRKFIERQIIFTQRMNGENFAGHLLPHEEFYYRVVKSKAEVYDIITRSFMRKRDWFELPHGLSLRTSWNLLWTWSKPQIDFNKLLLFQKVNHFPFNKNLVRKDLLKKNFERVIKLGAKAAQAFNILPLTYVLPKEYCNFSEKFYEESMREGDDSNIWIMKPVGKSQGRGISLVNDLSQVIYAEPVVVQKYMRDPLLLDGYKFDMRIYALITNMKPLEAFVYREGFARLSTEKYSLNAANIRNNQIHLTNFSIQKHHYDANSGANFIGGTKISLRMLQDKLRYKGIDWEKIWIQVQEIIVKSMLACQADIPNNPNCFEVFGYDIIIDSNLKCVLLEINSSPSLARDFIIDDLIKQQMVDDAIDLVAPVQFDRLRLLEVLDRRIREEQGNKSSINTTNNSKLQLNRDLNYILRGQKLRAHGETPKNIGQWQKVAPTEMSDKYQKIIQSYKLPSVRVNNTPNPNNTID